MERALEIAAGLFLIALAVFSLVAAIAVLREPERINYWPLPRHWFPKSWVRRDRLTKSLAYINVTMSIFGAALCLWIGLTLMLG